MNRFKVKKRNVPAPTPPKVERAVEEVEEWDGSASNYADAEAYCAACLIDVNEAAGNETKKQSHCMLPVKAPGSSAMADKAIVAAVGGRGITAVEKPEDVEQDAWDSAVGKAAKSLVSAYKQMDKEAPEAVVGLAGGGTQRSVMFEQVAHQIEAWTYAEPERPWLSSFYMETGALYGLFNNRGQLFRGRIDVATDGETVTIGELEPVKHEFVPTVRSYTPSSFCTVREADGRVRFFMIASTAVVNRVGEIDSTKLYDDMIRRAEETGFYPTLDFWHLGEVHPLFEFGQFDFLARDGVVYIGSGLLTEGHPLALAAEEATRERPQDWGASIEYLRPVDRGIEFVKLGTWDIPVLTEGLNTRISLLPEYAAASWFTNFALEERNVDARKLEALKKLFGNNEEKFRAYLVSIEGVNTEVRDSGVVTRDAEKAATTPTEPAPAAETGGVETTVDLDENTIGAFVEIARTQLTASFSAVEKELRDAITMISTQVAEFNTQLGVLAQAQAEALKAQAAINARVQTVEADEAQKQRTWLQDLPSSKMKPTVVTFRPSAQAPAGQPEQRSADQQAASVLAKLPKVGLN